MRSTLAHPLIHSGSLGEYVPAAVAQIVTDKTLGAKLGCIVLHTAKLHLHLPSLRPVLTYARLTL